MTMGNRHFGARVVRIEDQRLLSGKGRYVDDIAMPGLLHVAFVRSPEAHARIRGIDLSAARSMPGVVACLTARDLGSAGLAPMPQVLPNPNMRQSLTYHLLAVDEVAHVGVAVAAVVAESRAEAEDAAARVAVDYEVLPAMIDWRRTLEPGAPLGRHRADPRPVAARAVDPADHGLRTAPAAQRDGHRAVGEAVAQALLEKHGPWSAGA